ncbi:MAG: hypothetical protein P8J55_09840 [Pseudomonadales bacterium]|nr:hypothetical protein [Pseudomonadales bacterium]
MSSFIKGLWSRTKKDPEVRQLDHPRDLMTGDIVQLSDSFGLPEQLRNQAFKVVGISTWQFEHNFSTSFALQSQNDDSVDLTIEEEAGRETAVFSFAISRDVVEQLFDLDEFGSIFDEETTILTLQGAAGMDGLVAQQYHQISSGERGFYYENDYRDSCPPEYEGSGEPLDYYCLIDNEEAFAVEVEVYEGGETDVALTVYRDLDVIKELWPAEKS